MATEVIDVQKELVNRPDAVTFRKAFKAYRSGKNVFPVLRNFEMTVKRRTIYALLGASGCGKTTALSCVIGRHTLDAGEIRVFGKKPNTEGCGVPGTLVGYMPQEKGLSQNLTIGEMMQYFGKIYGMILDEIEMRITFLVRLLQLPQRSRYIFTLSGGQQKRISFAIALLHQPKLLILDEPTVGVDSLLRQMIWMHLQELTDKADTTIILTTHYIEEARHAGMVGLLRNGHLLAQDSPSSLLCQYNASTLEEVFLLLCVKDRDITSRKKSVYNIEIGEKDGSSVSCEKELSEIFRKASARDHVSAMLWKNVVWMKNDRLTTTMLLNLGPFVMFLYCLIIGGNLRKLNFAVVNHEWPQDPICLPFEGCLFLNVSCRFLQILQQKELTLVPYESEESAQKAVENADAWGFVSFSAKFSDSFSTRVLNSASNVDNASLGNSLIKTRLDMSSMYNYQIGLSLQRTLYETFYDLIKKLLETCEMNSLLAKPLVQFGEPIFGSNSSEFKEFLAPGVFMNALFGVMMFVTAALLMMERQDGMFERISAAGVSDLEFFLAQLIAQFFILVYVVSTMLLVMYTFIRLPIRSSFPWLMLLSSFQGACGIACGLLVSIVTSSYYSLMQINFGIVYPALLMSGVIWPLECMEYDWMRYVCLGAPSTYASEALRSMFIRGATAWDVSVWPGFASTLSWFTFYFVGTVVFLKVYKSRLFS